MSSLAIELYNCRDQEINESYKNVTVSGKTSLRFPLMLSQVGSIEDGSLGLQVKERGSRSQ